jgi:predicted type IV restriction endonuclease
MAVPARVEERCAAALKRYQPILTGARSRDVNEADTVVIVVDLLADLFGYDKYAEVTREHAIKNSFCDLALKVDGRVEFLIEVKPIGGDLKETHLKQAVDYAANEGIEWVALTNGAQWQVHRVTFGKPIGQELVLDLNLLELQPRKQEHIESLYLLTRESLSKSALTAFHDRKEAANRYFLAATILGDAVLDTIRREVRRANPDVKIDTEEIRLRLVNEVLKRDTIEGEKAEAAQKRVKRAAAKLMRARRAVAEDAAAPKLRVKKSEGDEEKKATVVPAALVQPTA